MSEELSPFMREIVARLDGKEKAADLGNRAVILRAGSKRITFGWLTPTVPKSAELAAQQRVLGYAQEGYGGPDNIAAFDYGMAVLVVWQCDATTGD